MLSLLSIALLATGGANALVSRGQSCCFHLSAMGGPGGPVDQLYDGQNRIGQRMLPEGQYCINEHGGITDGKGRGCILTPPTTQFQCDVGASPTPGFSVGCHGALKYKGDTTFYACPTGDNGGFNIYTRPAPNQPKCVKISLEADGCKAKCHAAPPPPAHKTCPVNIKGEHIAPNLIVPVNSAMPNTPYGTQYFGTIKGSISTTYGFDVPPSYSGKTCNLIFLLPKKSALVTSSYTYGGSGGIEFSRLKGPISTGTTYNNAPGVLTNYGVSNIHPMSSVSIAKFPCPGGKAISFKATSHGSSLHYFQDYNPPPIGAYIATC